MQLALIGGEEFADGFEKVHEALLSPLAKGKSRGVFLPTCAAHDGLTVVQTWCDKARFRLSPYVARVDAPVIMDRDSANDPAHADMVANADWVYLGGGFPHIGMEILKGTAVMTELRRAADRGALILGASAGAMMMCSRSIVISPALMAGDAPEPLECLGFVPRSMCLPHFNRSYARRWVDEEMRPPDVTLIGVDEQTALANTRGEWEVIGPGAVTVFAKHTPLTRYQTGQRVVL